eukprot:354121-Chlamydomonas_euryale.AAC.5
MSHTAPHTLSQPPLTPLRPNAPHTFAAKATLGEQLVCGLRAWHRLHGADCMTQVAWRGLHRGRLHGAGCTTHAAYLSVALASPSHTHAHMAQHTQRTLPVRLRCPMTAAFSSPPPTPLVPCSLLAELFDLKAHSLPAEQPFDLKAHSLPAECFDLKAHSCMAVACKRYSSDNRTSRLLHGTGTLLTTSDSPPRSATPFSSTISLSDPGAVFTNRTQQHHSSTAFSDRTQQHLSSTTFNDCAQQHHSTNALSNCPILCPQTGFYATACSRPSGCMHPAWRARYRPHATYVSDVRAPAAPRVASMLQPTLTASSNCLAAASSADACRARSMLLDGVRRARLPQLAETRQRRSGGSRRATPHGSA